MKLKNFKWFIFLCSLKLRKSRAVCLFTGNIRKIPFSILIATQREIYQSKKVNIKTLPRPYIKRTPHLSKGSCGRKQKCTQFLTPFSGTVFHALSHGVIHFVQIVSFKNLKMEVFDWLLKNFKQWESGFLT